MRSDVLHIMSEAGRPGVSALLHQRGKAAWEAAVRHPMVRQIAQGTLPYESFRRYFEQNILYLADYARAIGLIIGKAPTTGALDVLSRFLRQITSTEIPANAAFLRRLGGSPEEAEREGSMLPATYAYTRHLLWTAARYGCAEGLAAVLPCQWSYGELAQPLMTALPADPVYADWIAMFGNTEYAALVAETTGLLDQLADPADGTAVARLSWIFETSTRYEAEFWNMAYGGSARSSPAGKEGMRCAPRESTLT
jgi:thiaminase/transcriptional activator TenA